MNRSLMSVGLVAGALAIGVVLGSRPPNPPVPSGISIAIPALSTVEVHVAGWVVSPGVVTVEAGAIVADAVTAAGGFRPGARSELINLAAAVGSGEQILVPGPDEPGSDSLEGGLIPLNRATAAEFETLPGVGPVLAERIEAFRATNGLFEEIEDLLQVPGIGEAKLASIRDLVRLP